jgi:antitoxin component YwqK of YwqJK toxin-antitoxin module
VQKKIHQAIDKGTYFIIYADNKNKRKEGYWEVEFFTGYYKEYYSNGNLKAEGTYSNIEGKETEKVGRWVYYKKNGKTKRVKDYKLSGRQ